MFFFSTAFISVSIFYVLFIYFDELSLFVCFFFLNYFKLGVNIVIYKLSSYRFVCSEVVILREHLASGAKMRGRSLNRGKSDALRTHRG